MVSRVISFVVGTVLFPVVLLATSLDLTPRRGIRELEGISLPVVLFSFDDRPLQYVPPENWTVRGAADKLEFDTGNQLATAQWLIVKKPSAQGLSPEAIEMYREICLSGAPDAATEIAIEKEQKNSLILEGIQSYEIIVRYTISGRSFLKSRLFLDLNEEEQLQVEVTAPEKAFEAAYEAMRKSYYSLEIRENR